jgi:hypothetical protein
MAADRNRSPKNADDDMVDWFTVSYRTIYAVVGVVLLIAGAMAYHYWGRAPEVHVETPGTPSVTTTARFTSLEGTVKVKPVGQFEWKTADPSMELRKNDLVRTAASSTAEITFFDGTVVSVRPDSLITIEETSEDPSTKRRSVRWRVDNGGVQFTVPAAPGSREVRTPSLSATAQENSSGGVQVAQDGETDVRLFRGRGEVVTKTGAKVQLASNEGVSVDSGGKATAKVVLPGSPELQSPPHDAEITYPDPSRSTTLLTWKAVPGAASYHVMVDYSSHFSRPLVDRRGYGDTSVELRGLDAGKYYWRVAAMNKEGVEGAFADYARFSVAKGGTPAAAPKPKLRLEPLEPRGFIVQVKGATEAGATVSVNNQRIDVEPDGSFNEFVTLDRPGRQEVVVRAVGLGGGVAEEKRSVVVGY